MGSGKSGAGAVSKTYDWYGRIAAAICAGPVDALLAIIVNGREVWPLGGSTVSRASSDYADVTVQRYGTLRIYWGTDTQTASALMKPYHVSTNPIGNTLGHYHPDYRGICYVILRDWYLGREHINAPNLELIVRRAPVQSVITGDPALLADGQANAAAVAAELLTSRHGLEMDAAALDAAAFQAAADDLHARASLTGLSPAISNTKKIREVMASLAAYTDGYARYDLASGEIQTGVFPHGSAPASYHTLTADDLAEMLEFSAGGWSGAMTGVEIGFLDRNRYFKQTADTINDLRALKCVGEVRRETLDRPWITRRAQALAHGAEYLRTLGGPQITGTLTVRREKGRSIQVGEYVLADIDLEPGGSSLNQFFRVTERSVPPFGPIKLTVEADETLTPTLATPAVADENTDDEVPTALANVRIFEPPIHLGGAAGVVMILAERPTAETVGAGVWYDPADTDYQRLGTLVNFAARGTLNADITDSAAAITVNVPDQVDADRFEAAPTATEVEDDAWLVVLAEIVTGAIGETDGYAVLEVCSLEASTLIAAGQYTLDVRRARRGTAASAFSSAGAEVWLIQRDALQVFTHAEFATLRTNRHAGATPDTAAFKLTPYTRAGELALADATSLEYQFPLKVHAAPALNFCVAPDGATVLPWDAATAYALRNIAESGGRYWQCISAHTNHVPPNATYWVEITNAAAGQWPGDWAASTPYVVGDFVVNAGTYYRCKTAHTSGGSFSGTNWDDVSSPTAWASGASYSVGNIRGRNSTAFRCTAAHTSAAGNAPPDSHYWDSVSPFNHELRFVGVWTDSDANITDFKIYLQLAGEAETEEVDDSFAPTSAYAFDETIVIRGTGNWTVRLVAWDSSGLQSELVYALSAVGNYDKVAKPRFKQHGKRFKGEERNRFGKFKLVCATQGATISFRYKMIHDDGTPTVTDTGAWHTYDPDGNTRATCPIGFFWYFDDNMYGQDKCRLRIEAYASKSGMVDSDLEVVEIISENQRWIGGSAP